MDDKGIATPEDPKEELTRRKRTFEFRPIGGFHPRKENRVIAGIILALIGCAVMCILFSLQ